MDVQPNYFEKDNEVCRVELCERDEPILKTQLECDVKDMFRRNDDEQK